MADRSVVVRLRAEVAEFRRNMTEAARAAEGVGTATQKSAEKTSEQLKSEARETMQAFETISTTVGTGLLAIGGLAAAGVGTAVKRFSDFDQAMSIVQASTMETAENMEALRDAAIDAGAKTSFSATEAASGIEELAKAGVATTDILNGGLNGALDLAAAGGIGVGEAAETAASAMTQFGLKGADVTHIADLLSAGATKAQGGVGDLGQALNQSGLVANQFGLSVEDTVGTLTAFAKAGMVGSDAGTSLRTMLLRLANPTDEVKTLLKDLEIAAYDSTGAFVGIEDLAGQLETAMTDLTAAERDQYLAMIFGQDAIRASNILIEEGAEGISGWIEAVDEQGYAAEQAAMRLDNLAGDLEELGGSFETLMIGMGEGANGPLRTLTQGLTDVINRFAEMPEWVQQGALGLGAVTAAAGLTGGALLLAVPKAVEFYGALGKIGPVGIKAQNGLQRMGSALPTLAKAGAVAGALVGVAAAAAQVANMSTDAVPGIEATTAALLDLDSAAGMDPLNKLFAEGVDNPKKVYDLAESFRVLTQQSWDERINDQIGSFFGEVRDSDQAEEVFGNIGQSLADLVRSGNAGMAADQFEAMADMLGLSGEETEQLLKLLPPYEEALTGVANEQELAARGAEGLAGGLESTGGMAAEAEAELSSLAESLKSVGESFIDPLNIYKTQMQEMAQASADAANATAEDTGAAAQSWEDFADDVTVSLGDYAAELEKQISAQENWRGNLVTISQRGGTEVASILAAMGVEGQRLTEEMANATSEDFERMKNALIEESRLGGEGAARELEKHMGVMAVIGETGGKTTAQAIATQLGIGVDEVAEIAKGYGVELALGVNPVLSALGRREIAFQRAHTSNGAYGFAEGAVVNGGAENHVAQIAPAGAWRVWAEDETGGEAYIPLAPSKRKRSLDIWRETGLRLGVEDAEAYANGGFSSVEDVPRPRSTAPYRSPIAPPADATMEEAYSEAIAFIKENSLAGAGDIVGLGRKLQEMGFRISGHPSFGGVVAGGHRPGSLHYAGRAIDVNYGAGGQHPAETAAINALMPKLSGLKFAEKLWQTTGHYDHLHLAMKEGGILNPHVRDRGGPLLPGYTYNGTGGPETVVRDGAGSGEGRPSTVTYRQVHVEVNNHGSDRLSQRQVMTALREAEILDSDWGG